MTSPTITFAKRAAQSGHWYQNGKQVESVMGSKGKPVKPTLVHAKKLGLKPGITTILREAAAPALEVWKQKQVLQAALTMTRLPDEPDEAFVERILQDAGEQAEQAANAGTALHASIEEFLVSGKLLNPAHEQHVEAAVRELELVCGKQPWQCETVAESPLGYATKIDCWTSRWVIDWKSKDGDQAALDEIKLYDTHFEQLSSGHRALGPERVEPWDDGSCTLAIGFVSRTHPGAVRIKEATVEQCSRGLAMFDCLFTHWKLRTGYDPATGEVR